MSEAKTKPALQFRMASVSLKEAALDSPSFRASINHLGLQVHNIERWLNMLMKSVKKIAHNQLELDSLSSSFLEHLVPPFLQEGLIDQEYAFLGLTDVVAQLKHLYEILILAMTVKVPRTTSMVHLATRAIRRYKGVRRNFDKVQTKYDNYLAIYMSTPKSKLADSVYEDALHLYNVRKEYTHLSLVLVKAFTELGNVLDTELVRLICDIWSSKASHFSGWLFLAEYTERTRKLELWRTHHNNTVADMENEVVQARRQIEESSINNSVPSKEINSYRTFDIDQEFIDKYNDTKFEKHGYLFMKTYAEGSSKPIWVKRWAFIKGGLFGLLVLSPSQTSVQETDKIGLLLCHVKYAPEEDRKFCFDLKTVDLSLIFQAETKEEMCSWLKVFDNERRRMVSEGKDSALFNIASGRYPPLVMELASTANTVVDKQLVSLKIQNAFKHVITSTRLSQQIEKNLNYFQKYIYYQIPSLRPPILTESTKSSMISYSFVATNNLPTALTANIWGSINWGLYYLQEDVEFEGRYPQAELTNDDGEDNFFDNAVINGYPKYYLAELVPFDIQMRAIFETAIESNECCFFSFRCIWSPNSRQEFSGRCFVTSKHTYFFMQVSGFVTIRKIPIKGQVAVECTRETDYDLLRVHFIGGLTKVKIFMDDGEQIKEKLLYLINNNVRDKPNTNIGLLEGLKEIEVSCEERARATSVSNGRSPTSDFIAPEEQSLDKLSQRPPEQKFKVDFSDDGEKLLEGTYNLPPKAIFHAFLGDNSLILKNQSGFISLESYIRHAWTKMPNGNLYRKVNLNVTFGSSKKGQLQFEETIDNIVENEYYSFIHRTSTYKFFVGSSFSVANRIVIVKYTGRKSKVYIYTSKEFESRNLFNFLVEKGTFYYDRTLMRYLEALLKNMVRTIGTHGMIVKAIYLYGKLSYTDKFVDLPRPPVIKISLTSIVLHAIWWSVVSVFFSIVALFRFFFITLLILAKGVRMNLVLALLLLTSVVCNVFLSGRSTISYWTVRRADKIAHEYFQAEPLMIQRALYSQEARDYIQNIQNNTLHSNNTQSKCFQKYQESSFIINPDKTFDLRLDFADDSTREVARSLRKSYHDIGIKRNDLLIKLKILDKMEHEIAEGEWRNWLINESQKCQYVKHNIIDMLDARDPESLNSLAGVDSFLEYCSTCLHDYNRMELL